jgi:hypothetical protein
MKKLLLLAALTLTMASSAFAASYAGGINMLKVLQKSNLKVVDMSGDRHSYISARDVKEEIASILALDTHASKKVTLNCKNVSGWADCKLSITTTHGSSYESDEDSMMINFKLRGNRIKNNEVEVMTAG